MRLRRRLVPSSWLRLPRRSARTRLAALYAGLFLISGVGLLALTYGVTSRSASISVAPTRVGRVDRYPLAPAAAVPPASGLPTPRPLAPYLILRDGIVAQHTADLSQLRVASLIVLALMTAVSAGLGWLAAGRVLRPLRTITTTARTISAGNLHRRLALAGPDDEFKQLGDTLDDLFGRLERAFEAQRRFVANASHELRTPLTVERTLLQVALSDPDATVDTLRVTCEELLATGRAHERLLEALLTLASSERGLERREPVDLAAIAERVGLGFRVEVDRLGLELTSELTPAVATGDPALVERLVANLIDNAVQHNVPGGRIEVRTTTDEERGRLSVSNTGPVIAPGDVDRLFEPFQRLDGTRQGDAGRHQGLGLSIVRAIAAAHDAALAARALPDGGLAVTVSFARPGS